MPNTTDKSSPKMPYMFTDDHMMDIAKQREYFVVQGNDMAQRQTFNGKTRMGQSLTLTEEKVLNYLISQIPPKTQSLEPMIFDIKTFCEVCGLGRGSTDNCYPQVKKAVLSLASRVMWLKRDDGSITTVRYIQRATMYPRSGKIHIEFDKMMEPYLLNLVGNYFQFSFHNILAMNSKYSISLYKLLKSYCFMSPVIRFDIGDLKQRLDAESYKNIADLKSRVIIPAINDINQYTDLAVSVEYEKTGRATTHIVFGMKDLRRASSTEACSEADKRYYNVERFLEPDLMQQLDGRI